jgi:hypothetical protein
MVATREYRRPRQRSLNAMDPPAVATWVTVSIIVLAGARWRWVRVPGAILVTAATFVLLPNMPDALGHWSVVTLVHESCPENASAAAGALADGIRESMRTIMVPVAVLGVWAVIGDRWSGAKTRR